MKRCSTCNRTYTDPNLSFCIDDGTPLTTVEAEDEATVVSPRSDNEDWSTAPYQPPRAYVPPGGEAKRRRAWPWVLGIVGAFILGIIAISIAAAILAPKLIRRQLAQPPPSAGRPANTNHSANSNSNTANENIDQSTNESSDTPAPTDHAQVLAQLTDLENEWTAANLNADKKKLDRILADDFVVSSDGEPQSKAGYIRTIERDTDVDHWDFGDLKLTLIGDRATLSGTITYVLQGREIVFDFIDKFVWRDGRWQATGAELKRRE